MRNADAPPAGWYPDPDGRTRLRWWDGLDWTDIRRAPPSQAELIVAEREAELFAPNRNQVAARAVQQQGGGYSRQETQEIIAEVRNVARTELERAAEEFSQRASTVMRGFTPLVSEYTNKVLRWIKILLGIAAVLFIAWLLFQLIASQSFFDWLGDRIDNIGDQSSQMIVNGARPPS